VALILNLYRILTITLNSNLQNFLKNEP